jgi:transcriptional regulator with XRE-family HTH domain
MQSVGTYVRALREGRGMTANDLAFATGLNVTYIWRIESGETEDPGLERMSKIIEALKGKGDHLVALYLHPSPTDEYIQELARIALLTDEERTKAESFLGNDADTRALLEAVHEKAANPALRNRIRGYVDSLNAADVTPPVEKPKRASRRPRKK